MTDRRMEKSLLKSLNIPVVGRDSGLQNISPVDREVIVLSSAKTSRQSNKPNELVKGERVIGSLRLRLGANVETKISALGDPQVDYVPQVLRDRQNKKDTMDEGIGRLGDKETQKLLNVLADSTVALDTKSGDRQFGGLVQDGKGGRMKVLGRERVEEDVLVITARIEGYRTWIQLLIQSRRLENARSVLEVLDKYEEQVGRASDLETIQSINRQYEPFLANLAEELDQGDLETLIASRGDINEARKVLKEITAAPSIPRLLTKGRFVIGAKLSGKEVPFFDEIEVPGRVAGMLTRRTV